MAAKTKTRSNRSRRHPSTKPRGISDKAFKKVYWPYIPVVLAISILLSLSAQSGAISALIQKRSGQTLAYATTMSSSGLLSSSNSARAQNGVSSLGINSKLVAAAQAKANDMANRNYWSHNTPEGDPPWVFVSAQDYDYQKLGENLAAGFSDEQATVNGWMGSSAHRDNMLDPAFTQVGFGWANNANYTSGGGGPMTIVVAFYGKPQVLAAQSPPAAAPPASTAKNPAPAPAPASPAPDVAQPSEPVELPNNPQPSSPNTESDINLDGPTGTSSRAQLALASLPFATFATSLALVGSVVAIAIWVSKHALAVRRAIAKGESFAIRHPLLDIGLLIIAALSYLLTQTAGFIK